jgi:hypothetical protein
VSHSQKTACSDSQRGEKEKEIKFKTSDETMSNF